MEKRRDLSLDFIRVIAIWIILNFHFSASFLFYDSPLYTTANGSLGCVGTTVFFVLSGFLLRLKYKEIKSVRAFYAKRFLSIYPTFYVAFIVCFLFKAYKYRKLFYIGSPYKIIFSILGIDNYLGFYGISTYALVGEWFTAVIVAIYLIYPFINFLYNKSKLLVAVCVYGLYFANVFLKIDPVIVDASFFSGLGMFVTGIFLTEISGCIREKKWPGILGILISIVIIFVKLPGPYIIYLHILGIAMFVGLYFVFGEISKFIKNGKIVVFLSTVSYSVYVSHHFILNTLVPKIYPHITANYQYIFIYAGYLIVTLAVSIVLFYVTEYIVKAFKRTS